jgi:hypothetical protein
MDWQHFNTWFGNIASASAIAGTLVGYFPAIAASVALVWYLIQIAESETVRRYLANRRTRRIAKLRAKLMVLDVKHDVEVPPSGPTN